MSTSKTTYFDKNLMANLSSLAKEDIKKSWMALLGILLLISALEAIIVLSDLLWVKVITSSLLGLSFIRAFSIYHDMMHDAIFRKSPIAQFILKLFGLAVLNPPSVWKRSHNHHHKHNSKISVASIGSFPILTKKQFQQASTSERSIYLFTRSPLNILVGYVTVFLLGMCLLPLIRSPKKHYDALFAILLHIALLGALFFIDPTLMLWCYLYPLVLSSAIGAYLFYVQHNFEGMQLLLDKQWDYFYAALHSTSYFQMPAIIQWFMGNIGYHHIHHLNAQVPFYNLPVAMNKLQELQSPPTISWSIQDIRSCFAQCVWDESTESMITKKSIG